MNRRLQVGALTLLLLIAPALAQGPVSPGLFEQPVLVIDPGMHTAPIRRADVDAKGSYAVTGSHDHTVRVWSVVDGRLLRTIRPPVGPWDVGRIEAVAISPDGERIAAGGWTRWTEADPQEQIYVFERQTGTVTHRIEGLPSTVNHLVFSSDGRHLAAMLSEGNGLRVFDRDAEWAEIARDADYGDDSYGAAFAPDGRLATTNFDGQIRLYDAKFQLTTRAQAPGGARPFGIDFSPDGRRLAVGYDDSTAVDLLDGATLGRLPPPDTDGIDNGDLSKVAWSADGTMLYAGGRYDKGDGTFPVLSWPPGGSGRRQMLPAGINTVASLVGLPDGGLLIGAQDPYLGVLALNGSERWARRPPQADFRAHRAAAIALSTDASIVDFAFRTGGTVPARFDLKTLDLRLDPPADGQTSKPEQTTLKVEDWEDHRAPTLDGEPLPLDRFEISRSLAIHPDGRRFVLGADWWLRAFDKAGEPLWRQVAPGVVRAVNISGDGRLVVAGYGDGTIRWHRMDDGRELLAFFPLADRRNWVAWTPEGFYGATPGAYGVLRWHVNRGWDQAAETIPVNEIPLLRRPRVLPLVLQEMETARALGLDDLQQAMRAVQLRTRSTVRPGAQLHVLAVGVSDYGEAAQQLRLRYAHNDAHDIASALLSTQSSLYAKVEPQVLRDTEATRGGILRALATMRTRMAAGETGRDLAVVFFSGHGAVVEDKFYLLPYGVDARDPVGIKDSGLQISTLQDELRRLGQLGRVLVLLDACHAGASFDDGSDLAVNSTILRTALATANVTVLTSSEAGQLSRESPSWENGAFTEILLEALQRADSNRNGLISVTELMDHLGSRVPQLTSDQQTPGIEARFGSDVFVSGM